MSQDPRSETITNIETGGGTYIEGSVTVDGDFVNGNKIIVSKEVAYNVEGLPNPYLGLRPFTYKDRSIYGGRDTEIQKAVQKLTHPGEEQTTLFVTGASGSGKSSFVQAGLLPKLLEYYEGRHKKVRFAVFQPGNAPGAMLDDALSQLAPGSSRDLTSFTAVDEINILIIDQFEEVFTQAHLPADDPFFQWIRQIPPVKQGRTHLIATVRADYLDELFNLAELYDLNRQGIDLRAMSKEELCEAIQKPLQAQFPTGEKRFEAELVQKLADEASASPTLLPLLQVTLEELWKKGTLKLAAYTNLSEAIRHRADQVLDYHDFDQPVPSQNRSQADREKILQIFVNLVQVSLDDDHRRDVRRIYPKDKLPSDLVDELSRARLLSVNLEQTKQEVVTIIHEALISNWDRLRQEVQYRRQDLQRRTRFEQQVKEWTANKKQDSYLLTGIHLANARTLDLDAMALDTPDARELLKQSIQASEAEASAKVRQRMLILALIAGIALIIALGSGFFAIQSSRQKTEIGIKATEVAMERSVAQAASTRAVEQQQDAERQRFFAQQQSTIAQQQSTIAQQQKVAAQRSAISAVAAQLAANSQLASTVQRDRADSNPLLLAREAVYKTWLTNTTVITQPFVTMEADRALRLASADAGAWQMTLPAHRQQGQLWDVAYSPTEAKVAAAINDQTAAIWDVATGQQLVRLIGHQHIVRVVKFSPDGKTIVTTSPDSTARLWDVATGKPLFVIRSKGVSSGAAFSPDGRILVTSGSIATAHLWDTSTGTAIGDLRGHTAPLNAVAFSRDGKLIISSGDDHTARIWDVATLSTTQILTGNEDEVLWASFSPDSTLAVTAGKDKSVRLWDVRTGQELYNFEGHARQVRRAIFSPDGKLIASSTQDQRDKGIRIWDVAQRKLLRFIETPATVLGLDFSPDGKMLVAGDSDSTMRLWDVESGAEIRHQEGHTKKVTAVAYSPDGKVIATAGSDEEVHLWNPKTGTELQVIRVLTDTRAIAFSPDSQLLAIGAENTIRLHMADGSAAIRELPGHTDKINAILFTHQGSWLVSAGADQTIRLWEIQSGKEITQFQGHTGAVQAISLSVDDTRLVSVGADNTMRLWDVATGQEILSFTGHVEELTSVAFSPDGKLVVTGGVDHTIRLWDVQTGTELRPILGNEDRINAVAFSSDGQFLLTGSNDWSARLFDVATGKELRRFDGHTDAVLAAIFSPDGQTIVTGSNDRTVRVWYVDPPRPVEELVGHSDDVHWAVFAPDNKTIATASSDDTVRLWNVETGKATFILQDHTDDVNGVMFSPDGQTLLSASYDKTARLWDVATGQSRQVYEGHEDAVLLAAFSPDGKMMATASADKTAFLWNLESGQIIQRLIGHKNQVRSAIFSPDGKLVVTASDDWSVRLWDVQNGQELRQFTGHTFPATYASFSPDGNFILSTAKDRFAILWDVKSGEVIRRFEHAHEVEMASFSSDGRYIATGCADHSINLWDVTTGVRIRRIEEHTAEASSVFFSADDKWILSASHDQTVRLWLASMNDLLTLATQRIQRDPPILGALIVR